MPIPRLRELQTQVNDKIAALRGGGVGKLNRQQLEDLAIQVLTRRAMEVAPLHEISSATAVDKAWNKKAQFFQSTFRDYAMFMSDDDLEILLRQDHGEQMQADFRRYLARQRHISPDTPRHLLPTARMRIKYLQAASGNYRSIEDKRIFLSEVFAARRAVGAGRDGTFTTDGRLNDIVLPNVSQTAQSLMDDLQKLSNDEVEAMFQQVSTEWGMGSRANERFEDLRKTPIQRRIEEQQLVTRDNDIDKDKQALANLIWLREHKNVSQEDLAELEREEDRPDPNNPGRTVKASLRQLQVQEIENRPEFQYFLKDYAEDQLINLIGQVDINAPDPFGELGRAYDHSSRDYHTLTDPHLSQFEEIVADPQKGVVLKNDLTQMLEDDGLQEALQGNPIGFLILQTMGRLRQTLIPDVEEELLAPEGEDARGKELADITTALAAPGTKGDFLQNLSDLRSYLTWYRAQYPENYAYITGSQPELAQLANSLRLPEPGTMAEYEQVLRGSVLATGGKGDAELRDFLYAKIAVHELVGNKPNWRAEPYNPEVQAQIDARVAELRSGVPQHGDPFADLTTQDMERMLVDPDAGAHITEFHKNFVDNALQAQEQARQNIVTQTADEKLEELLQFPLWKEALKHEKALDEYHGKELTCEVMASRALAREYQANPGQFKTAADVYRRHLELEKVFGRFTGATLATHHNISTYSIQDSGRQLEADFRLAMRGHIKYEDFLRVPREDLPTGRQHIKALQRAAEKDLERQVHSSSTMMYTMASLLGARRSMEVQANVWGGDSRMDQKLPAATFVQASERVYNDLKTLTQEELEGLYGQAIKGHGGALEKAFEQTMYKKALQMDQLPRDLPQNRWPTAKDRIEALQDKIRTTDDPEKKREYTLQIIAARQTVHAQRQGLYLDQRLDPEKYARQIELVKESVALTPQDQLDDLTAKALDGHGGQMVESFNQNNTFPKRVEAVMGEYKYGSVDPKVDIATATALILMADRFKNAPYTYVDEAQVRQTAQQLREMPGFDEYANSGVTETLLGEGNAQELSQHLTSFRDEAMAQQPAQQPVDPEKAVQNAIIQQPQGNIEDVTVADPEQDLNQL